MSLSRPLQVAFDDARLLNLPLWPRQRDVLATIEAHHTTILQLGRRSGKTTMAAGVALHNVTLCPHLDAMVRPGETRYAVVAATNRRQARLSVDAARSMVLASPALRQLLVGDSEDELRFLLPSGARTAFLAMPCSSRGNRGFPISMLFKDEFAHFLSDTDGPATAKRMLDSLLPATAQFGDAAKVIIASTPFGPDTLFTELFEKAKRGDLPGWGVFEETTRGMNPTITDAFLAMEEIRDPVQYRQEYLNEVVAAGDAFIDLDRAVVRDGDHAAPASAGERWVCGIDPAFAAKGDAFGVALVGRARDSQDRRDLVVGPVLALRPDGDHSGVLDRVALIAEEYNARVVTDQYSAASVVQHLSRRGLTVAQHTMTATSKTNVFNELRARLYERSLPLPGQADLLAELRRLQTQFRAGSAAVTNPRVGGSHGDMAQALALAVYEHRVSSSATSEDYAPGLDSMRPAVRRGDMTLQGDRYLDEGVGGDLVPPPGWSECRS